MNYDRIAQDIKSGIKKGKNSSIIIVGEGEKPGLSSEVKSILERDHQIPAHVCILGHIQRGGAPTHQDRFISSKMGNLAIKYLLEKNDKQPVATVVVSGKVITTSLDNCFETKIDYEKNYLELVRELSI